MGWLRSKDTPNWLMATSLPLAIAVGVVVAPLIRSANPSDLPYSDFMVDGAQEAILAVQTAPRPLPQVFGQPIGQQQTWKEAAERETITSEGSLDGCLWAANRDNPALEDGEWIVSFVCNGAGLEWSVRPRTRKVVCLNEDPFASFRLGKFKPSKNPDLILEVQSASMVPCRAGLSTKSSGLCLAVKGLARPAQTIVSIEADAYALLSIDGRVHEGIPYPDVKEDPFKDTSVHRPWHASETRTFTYYSNMLPDVYRQGQGQLLTFFRARVGTLNHGPVRQYLWIESSSWPP